MENNKLSKIIAVVLVLFLSGGAAAFAYYTYTQKQQEETAEKMQQVAKVNEAQDQKQQDEMSKKLAKGSLLDFFNKSGNQMCTFTSDGGEGAVEGTVYVSDKKMKGDFGMDVNGAAVETHMISDGEFMYMWTDLLPQGYKMSLLDLEKQAEDANLPDAPSNSATDNLKSLNQAVNYNCDSWDVDESYFEVPTNVTFTDFSAMLETVKDAGDAVKENVGGNMCNTCNLIPDATAKQECLANFSCN